MRSRSGSGAATVAGLGSVSVSRELLVKPGCWCPGVYRLSPVVDHWERFEVCALLKALCDP